MKRYIVSLIFLGISVCFVFNTSYKTQNAKDLLNNINREIDKTEDVIHVVKTEWAYLTTPERLKKLIREQEYLHNRLRPQNLEQIKRQDIQLAFNNEVQDDK